ncbi:hypothetical protein Poli38472_003981 [Pythium oligandrum]|uniref:DUF4211 domain-containing protein n=1 Tax=Pythium oligandrum TaxID=41045 RepID=A0A8K1CM83_PYTOL|nr:hypothetical protein Poli38472_003981 [Pythium oligandrum]|eukprot:TMW66216.1 hypothetical protein Poli38472_003981 [Pythium oligandrum]
MMRQYEEVVIDGDSSDDAELVEPRVDVDDDEEEDAVVVITPQSRKRRRQSTIMDEDDEEEVAPLVRTPKKPQQQRQEEDDDDDEVEIIAVASGSSVSGSSAKKRRRTIFESDEEEPEEDTAVVRRLSLTRNTPVMTKVKDERSSSSQRSSSRIERKRQEKGSSGASARKLEFRSLDNCLDHLKGQERDGTGEEDGDDFIEEEDEEEATPPSRKRQRPRPSTRERHYADGGEDLDEFIVDDDDVEYMDEDEEGVMGGTVSNEEEDLGQSDEEVRVSMQSRDPIEWFEIYLQYLEESILDADLDKKMRKTKGNRTYQLFRQACHHIERAICSRRDALRSSVVWPADLMSSLRYATAVHFNRCDVEQDCQACNRRNHYATQRVRFGGVLCDATELYKENWMSKLRRDIQEREPVDDTFELGSVCHARTLVYWQLLHAKHFWVALVDAKRHESGDGQGRIADDERKTFYKQEYGRYKRLLELVDRFSTDGQKQSTYHMPNVWKKVTSRHVHSEFLPVIGDNSVQGNESRRGTMDSFVGDSEDESEGQGDREEEEEKEEEDESKEQTDHEEEKAPTLTRPSPAPSPLRKLRQSSLLAVLNKKSPLKVVPSRGGSPMVKSESPKVKSETSSVKSESPTVKSETASPSNRKPAGEVEVEDLTCLVCKERQRDGGVVHGHYLHLYACYGCAKRQFTARLGCMVCDRPIDRVLQILPLSKHAKEAILREQRD